MSQMDLTVGTELPDQPFEWKDLNGNVIDFSSGHTFSFRIGAATPFVKSSGITGAATSPNVTVSFSAGELDAITPGVYLGELHARRTSDSKDRVPLRFRVVVKAPIPAA